MLPIAMCKLFKEVVLLISHLLLRLAYLFMKSVPVTDYVWDIFVYAVLCLGAWQVQIKPTYLLTIMRRYIHTYFYTQMHGCICACIHTIYARTQVCYGKLMPLLFIYLSDIAYDYLFNYYLLFILCLLFIWLLFIYVFYCLFNQFCHFIYLLFTTVYLFNQSISLMAVYLITIYLLFILCLLFT